MVFEQIERLKQQYTDQYVVVDDTRPELRRFRGQTGTVKTVNMSGRALVQFDAYENIGWYDIDVDFLKIIDAPLPKPEKPVARTTEKPAAKGAGGKSAAAAPAATKPAATKPAATSVEEMLAAARGQKAGGAAKSPVSAGVPAAGQAKAADKPVSSSAAGAKLKPGQMSVEEMLAAARGEKQGGAPTAEPPKKKAAAPAEESVQKAARPAATQESVGETKKLDPKQMSVADILAAARGGAAGKAAAEPELAAVEARPAARETSVEAGDAEPAAESTPRRSDLPQDVDGILAYCRRTDAAR